MTMYTSNLDPMHTRRTVKNRGFTLLELLIVIGVISILLGMLLTAIRAVTQHTRRTIARAEVRMLEGAWKQYFTHYQQWPAHERFGDVFVITADIAKGLEGRDVSDLLPGFNPEGIAFMEFTRFNSDAAPINPAQAPIYHAELPDINGVVDGRHFFCLLNPDDAETLVTPDPGSQPVARDVIVWTYDERFSRNPTPERIIGSWQP